MTNVAGVLRAPLRIYKLGDHCLTVGAGLRLGLHTAHAVTIASALRGRILVRFAGSDWQSCTTAIIAPDTPHELNAQDAWACTLLLGPETPEGRRFESHSTLLETDPGFAFDPEPNATCRAMARRYATIDRPRPIDPRVLHVLRLLREADEDRLAVTDIASAVSLSPSRLIHLFHEQTRISIKRYSLWLRLHAAFDAMTAGRSLTEIAYAAGFSDPAHLSRSFHKMLGMRPSDVGRFLTPADESGLA